MKVSILITLIATWRVVDGATLFKSPRFFSQNEVIKSTTSKKTTSGIDALHNVPALDVRGGGAGDMGDNLAAAYIVIHAIPGALLPAPNKVSEFYNWKTKSNFAPGSFQEFIQENYISTCIGIALLTYLTIFKSMDPVKAVAYSTLGCCYVNYKALLNDSFAKWGAPKGIGVISVALFAGLYYAVFFSGSADASLITKLFMAPITLLSLVGVFDPAAAKDALGAKTQTLIPAANKTQMLWMCRAILIQALAGYSLMFGADPMTAAGRASLLGGLFALDSGFITKDTADVSPQSTLALFTVVYALIGVGLLTAAK